MDKNRSENIIDGDFLEELLAAHEGNMALLYLYCLRFGELDREDAARQLCLTMGEVDAAEEKLRRIADYLGKAGPERVKKDSPSPKKVSRKKSESAEPAGELPQYTAEEIARRSEGDIIFAGLQSECVKVIGHALSSSDIKTLFGIYDYLALPPEVIMELLNYCASVFTEKYGTGRRPGMRAIEKEAYRWAKKEILTFEQAETYIRHQKELRSKIGSLKTMLGIKDRVLSKSELKYMSSWLEMGFDEEAISIAYDRTVTSTGGLKWAYMNTILQNWHNANLHSPAEINERDGRRVKAPTPASPKTTAPSFNIEELKNAINKI